MKTPEERAAELLPCKYPKIGVCGGELKIDEDYHWEYCQASARQAVAAELRRMEDEIDKLMAEVDRLKADNERLERERLNYVTGRPSRIL